MKARQILFSLVMIVALDGVAAWAQKVNVDWDKSANFQGYSTYARTKGTPAKNQLMDERIVAAGWGDGTSTTTVQKIPVGELVVDIGDPNTKKMLWQGTATDTVNDNPDKTAKKIDKAVEKMFKKFPPPAKEKD